MLAVQSLAKSSHALKNEPRLSVRQSIANVPMAKYPHYDSQVFDQSMTDAMRARQFHGLRFGVKYITTAPFLPKEITPLQETSSLQ
jgi:hypothetical protein